jgi:putative ABC transport system substrate-binding protein
MQVRWKVIRYGVTLLVIAVLLNSFGVASAQQDRRLPTIGQVFFVDRATAKPYDEAFRAGLRALGYVEGQNIAILARYANGQDHHVPPLVRELIALPVDVLFVSPSVVRYAKQATTTVPIVCANMLDAVESGLVASLSRPGGNLTGLTYQGVESDSKRLELARELVPALRRLAVLFDATFQSDAYAGRIRRLGQKEGITVEAFGVHNLEETRSALLAIERTRPQALILYGSPRFMQHRRTIFDFTVSRFPVVADEADYAKAGAVVTYAEDDFDLFRRGAGYVDKILKGANPGDLPIEQSTKFDFVVNLRSARALGIVIPESMMVRATELIR